MTTRAFIFSLCHPVVLCLGLLLVMCRTSGAQTVFWTEAFSNGCTSGCAVATYTTGPNGTWTQSNTGTNGTSANRWYVSGAENGNAANTCGTSGSDPSLHLGSTTLGDIGAAYDAGRTTNRRAESPVINCSGYSNITLSFNYIENGEGTTDDAIIEYFNGTTWATLLNTAKSTLCSSGQGQWTAAAVSLPASANNNTNVKIGFRWTNNNVSGTDPSFAVDDITLSVAAPLPVEMLSFTADEEDDNVVLRWVTATETNNDYFIVERSADGVKFFPVATVDGHGTSSMLHEYSTVDREPLYGLAYYRLKQVDHNGTYSLSKIVAVETGKENGNWFSVAGTENMITVSVDEDAGDAEVDLVDVTGRVLRRLMLPEGERYAYFNTSSLAGGAYIIRISSGARTGVRKIIR